MSSYKHEMTIRLDNAGFLGRLWSGNGVTDACIDTSTVADDWDVSACREEDGMVHIYLRRRRMWSKDDANTVLSALVAGGSNTIRALRDLEHHKVSVGEVLKMLKRRGVEQ